MKADTPVTDSVARRHLICVCVVLQVAWFSFGVSRSSCSFHCCPIRRDWTRSRVCEYRWSFYFLCFTSMLPSMLFWADLCSVSLCFKSLLQAQSHFHIVHWDSVYTTVELVQDCPAHNQAQQETWSNLRVTWDACGASWGSPGWWAMPSLPWLGIREHGNMNIALVDIAELPGDWQLELVSAYGKWSGDKHGVCWTYQGLHGNWEWGIGFVYSIFFRLFLHSLIHIVFFLTVLLEWQERQPVCKETQCQQFQKFCFFESSLNLEKLAGWTKIESCSSITSHCSRSSSCHFHGSGSQ